MQDNITKCSLIFHLTMTHNFNKLTILLFSHAYVHIYMCYFSAGGHNKLALFYS